MLKGNLQARPLPPIPAKRYFTIGEVSELCGVKPHVLRYWEQEFAQLKPVKRRGNRRYYQHHEVLLIRRIRELLYEQGFTISGARNRLDARAGSRVDADSASDADHGRTALDGAGSEGLAVHAANGARNGFDGAGPAAANDDAIAFMRNELLEIVALLRN